MDKNKCPFSKSVAVSFSDFYKGALFSRIIDFYRICSKCYFKYSISVIYYVAEKYACKYSCRNRYLFTEKNPKKYKNLNKWRTLLKKYR